MFHTLVAKALFVAKRSRPDILPVTSVLSGRVKEPSVDDWAKARRLVKYLNGTKEKHLVIDMQNFNSPTWFADASYGVYSEFKWQSGGLLISSKDSGGVITAGSRKQQLNTRLPTEVELVAVDDFLSQILHMQHFLRAQGMSIKKSIINQDNQSTILLSEKGRSSLGKWTRHFALHYFYVTDVVTRGEVKIRYCPTQDIIGDYMTKPLQGVLFYKFRKQILGM